MSIWGNQEYGVTAQGAWAQQMEHAAGDGNPAQKATYIIFYDPADSRYKTRNGLDGTIDYNSTDPKTTIQETFDAAAALNPSGYVIFKPAYYDITDDLTIPDPVAPGFTIDFGGAAILRPSSTYAGSGPFIQTSNNTQNNIILKNWRIHDPWTKLAGIMIECNHFQHCRIENMLLSSDSAAVGLDFDGDHWNIIDLKQLIIGNGVGLRLGNANATNANRVLIESAGGANMTCVQSVSAGCNYIYVQDISQASVGFSIAGSGNIIYARFEGGYGPAANVVDPVKFTSASKDNIFYPLLTLTSKMRHYITREGIGNKVVHPGFQTILFDSFGGNGLMAKWLSTTGGTGTFTQANRYVQLDSGAVTGGTSQLDFNAKLIGYGRLGPWMDMSAQLTATTQQTVQLQLRKDANNICEFKHDPGAGAANWFAITTIGGAPTSTNTGIAADTALHLFAILVFQAASKVQYCIDGVLVASHTADTDLWQFEPFFYVINKENLTKKLYLWEVQIQEDQYRP